MKVGAGGAIASLGAFADIDAALGVAGTAWRIGFRAMAAWQERDCAGEPQHGEASTDATAGASAACTAFVAPGIVPEWCECMPPLVTGIAMACAGSGFCCCGIAAGESPADVKAGAKHAGTHVHAKEEVNSSSTPNTLATMDLAFTLENATLRAVPMQTQSYAHHLMQTRLMQTQSY